jgi:hypothetical protein
VKDVVKPLNQNRMEQNIERCYEPSEKQVCCYPDCNEKAEFHLQELGMGTTYEDYTELCAKHLDEMIPFGSSFEVWRLDN